MVYTSNIPQATDDPSQSQSQILANFQGISTLINVNHVDFDDGDEGKHKFLQMPVQAVLPGTVASEGSLYTKTASGETELFWEKDNSATEIQLTSGSILAATKGYTFLPGKLLLQWGSGAASTPIGAIIMFPTAFSASAYQVVTTNNITTSGVQTSNFTSTTFTATGGATSFSYIAIGPA